VALNLLREYHMSEIKQRFEVNGQFFDSKAEALEFIRVPKIKAALAPLTDNNAELMEWLIANQDEVTNAFNVGTIRRVSKKERANLEAGFKALADNHQGDKEYAFLIDNAAAIVASFKWPTEKRMSPEEKAVESKKQLLSLTEGNEDLSNWIVANSEGVLAAYEEGKEKRQVSEKATNALAEWRAKKAAEKAAAGA
jgi:hypothetical protein